ncbi:MAG: hypothetical protein GF311_20845 [Candidatus Lokiarchaeota archaeon]|nr:hypothetical protein [Candidatus Lokiarchaeota archaeon]
MSHQKKFVKKRIFALSVILLIILSGFLFLGNLDTEFYDSNTGHENINPILSSNWDTELDKNISGLGNNQKVRVYLQNQSSSIDNSGGSFEIGAADDTYLDSGNFLFQFANNFTTNHTMVFDSTDLYNFTFNNETKLGLEFDIRGNTTIFHGFYAFLNTTNPAAATNTEINISLYKADTFTQNRGILSCIPENYIDSTVISDVVSDNLAYYPFPDTSLEPFNYFIVLTTNNSLNAYSLIAHWNNEGEGETNEHLLEMDIGDGWELAQRSISGGGQSNDFDASSFTVNVTRGYMPTDFEVDSNKTLRIQNIPLNDTREVSFIYSSIYQWGVGSWDAEFPNPVYDGADDDFDIALTWNQSGTGITDFSFNLSYIAIAYHEGESTATYLADYNGDIEWSLEYTLSSNWLTLDNWNFTEMWFLYPWYHNNLSLITPSTGSQNVLDQTAGETRLHENNTLDKLVIPYSLSNFSGLYELNLTSLNVLNQIYSYINYKGNLLETSGFMFEDNMTIGADITGPGTFAPTGGTANATLFNPVGSVYATDTESPGTLSFDKTLLTYDFNNNTLLEVDASVPEGIYYLAIIWENGSLIGIGNIPIYINHYELTFKELNELEDENSFLLTDISRFNDKNDDYYPYQLLGASINETDEFPDNFYAIKQEQLAQKFLYKNEIELELRNFLQNESIINPEEEISFKITLKNNRRGITIPNVKVSVKLVSPINDNWIMATDDSTLQTLEGAGNPNGNDQKNFTVSLQMPNIEGPDGFWPGYNSPIRLGGAKTIITIYIDNEEIYSYNSPDLGLLVNQTEDLFEGYILSLSNTPEGTDNGASIQIPRDKCIYTPEKTTLLINIQDYNHISSYQLYSNTYEMNKSSKFQSIATTPETPVQGESFNLTSQLTTEFGTILPGETVNCESYNGTDWVLIGNSPQGTDSDGKTTFHIDTTAIIIENNIVQLRLSWDGKENITGTNKEINVTLFSYNNELSISANFRNPPIYRNSEAVLDITLTNIGDSNLNITSILLTFPGISPFYQIIAKDSYSLQFFEPGKSTAMVYKISFQSIPTNTLSINVSIIATNIDTSETITVETTISVSVLDYPIFENFMNFFTLIMISILALIIAISLYYSYILKRRIETPVSKPAAKKKRRGVYKKVSEIKEETEKEEKKKAKKKKTDLDSLLEEEGI